MKSLRTPSSRLGNRGFSHHFILPVIAIIAVAGIGAYTLHAIHAASSQYYNGACSMKKTLSTTTNSSDLCVYNAQALMNAVEHHQISTGNSYRTAVSAGSGATFVYGKDTKGKTAWYVAMTGKFNADTANAVKRMSGSTTLTDGTSGTWQTLCKAAAAANMATNKKDGANGLNFGAVKFPNGTKVSTTQASTGGAKMYQIFQGACGTLTNVKSSTGGTATGSTGSTSSGTSSGGSGTTASSSSGAPTARLGVYVSAEDGGTFSTVSGQKPDVANTYLYWNSAWPSKFVSGAESAGATPYVELEPWTGSESGAPQFSDITSGKYDTWLESLGSSVKTLNKPVIFTFAHEFNVSGQYPWSAGDKGSCGTSSSCTPTQWIAAWDHVEATVNKTAGGHAYWMWTPNADTGGTTESPVAYWPGTSEVQMVGVDGYPDTQYGSQFGTFSGEFGPVFKEIKTKTTLPIFIAETDLEPLGSSGYETIPNFVKDLFAAGGTGVLEWEDGSPKMSSSQWSQLDTALAAYPK